MGENEFDAVLHRLPHRNTTSVGFDGVVARTTEEIAHKIPEHLDSAFAMGEGWNVSVSDV